MSFPRKLRGALRTAFLCLAFLLLSPKVKADWAGFGSYSVLIQASLEENAVNVNFRLRQSALPRLRELLGLPDGAASTDIASRLLGLAADGKALPPPRLAGVDAGQAQPSAGIAEPHFEVEARFPLARRPALLSLIPPERAGKDLGFIVLHRGVPVNDLAPLARPARLKPDWNSPWNSRFDDPGLVRRHSEPRSYVYVEPYEVRHELLLRLVDLLPRLDFAPANPRRIGKDERAPLQQALGRLLLELKPMRIDGATPEPHPDRIEFVRYSRAGMESVGPEEPLDAATAVVGAILVYFTEKPAAALELEWNLFGAGPGQDTRAFSLQLGKETFDSYVTAREPVFQWSAEEALEPAAAPDAAAEAPAAARQDSARSVQAALPALLHNVYRAFQIPEEEAAYDRLAMSLEGDILDEVYLRQRRALLRRDRGLGGEGRVERIETLESRVDAVDPDSGTCIVTARWMAHGTISHWGHSHPRSNVYAARLILRPAEAGHWKITGLEFTENKAAGAT